MDIDSIRNYQVSFAIVFFVLICSVSSCNSKEYHPGDERVVVFEDLHRFSVRHNNQRLQIIRFIKFADDAINIPILMRKQPRFGIFNVYKQVRAESIKYFVGPKQEYIYLPVSKEIVTYVFLLRDLEDLTDSPWYLLEVPKKELDFLDNSNISFPLVNTLQLLSKQTYEQKYEPLVSIAEKEYHALRATEK